MTTHYTYGITEKMFVATADQNYILARWAALNQLNVDFFWMGLHAVEKYLKAILLLNDKSAKGFQHNIVRLHGAVLKLDPRLSFGLLERPPLIPEDHLHWKTETAEAFIDRLDKLGDPNNRYMLYGWVQHWPQDMIKLDFLVWRIRRHCRPFTWSIRGPSVDWVQCLAQYPEEWSLNTSLALERGLAGHLSPTIQEALQTLNYAFAPHVSHNLEPWAKSWANPPIAEWFRLHSASTADQRTSATVRQTLEWVLQNIELSKSDRKEIETELQKTKTP